MVAKTKNPHKIQTELLKIQLPLDFEEVNDKVLYALNYLNVISLST